MNIFSKLALVGTGTATILSFATSSALAEIYDFEVKDLTGQLAGQTFKGWVTFDETDLKGTGFEYTGIKYQHLDGVEHEAEFDGKLKFHFDFLDDHFTEKDDLFERTYLYFQDGKPTHIFYDTEDYIKSYQGVNYTIWFSPTGGNDGSGSEIKHRPFEYMFDYPSEWFGNGTVEFTKRAVPEPNPTLGVGMMGLAVVLKQGFKRLSSSS